MRPVDPERRDPRIARLLDPQGFHNYYDRDTQDMIAVLIEKLQSGSGDPLKRAKEELGQSGPRAARELQRLFEENFTSQLGAPYLENAIDAASLNPHPEAHDILMAALDHPMQAVRHRSLIGLIAQHAGPDDFDALRQRFQTRDDPQIRRMYLRAMFKADRARADEAALNWIRREAFPPFRFDLAKEVSKSDERETGLGCAEIFADLEPPYRTLLAGPAARVGDERAIEYLRAELEAEDATRRLRAVIAISEAGMLAELARAIETDGSPQVRAKALEGFAQLERPSPDELAWMAYALNDPARDVREHALTLLCGAGHPGALDQALAQLQGDPATVQASLLALRIPMGLDEDVARRAYDQLVQRIELEALRPLESRAPVLKALGHIPLREAAEYLRALGVELQDREFEGKRFHDWITIHASNTGTRGRTYLWEALQTEQDFARRLDLISAVSSVREDAARERLLEWMERSENPYEQLYCAVQALRIGPASILAPRLQQFCYGMEHSDTRAALQAMLWHWY